MEILQKLSILADAAKYDASCASSGVKNRDSVGGRGMGSANGTGICHSYTPDGRCVSLLKILLTNFCLYDCQYCINRKSSNVRRARFDVEEVVQLTLDFYRRNLIEGLFLSSGIIRSADYTMEQLVRVAKELRQVHDFRGYIHLKAIPEASPEMLTQAGLFADRLSINIELPTQSSLEKLAPEKSLESIHHSMGEIATKVQESAMERAESQDRVQSSPGGRGPRRSAVPRFAPGGQSTQLIVGADASDDNQILQLSSNLYSSHRLRRVYYSAFSPIPESPSMLPLGQPPMMREHRLYQADWLLRNYGFAVSEIGGSLQNGMLDLELDPKLAWALQQRHRFPINLNTAAREDILRVPGLGSKSVDLLLRARRSRSLRLSDLAKLRIRLDKVRPFVEVVDHHPHTTLDDPQLRSRLLTAQTAGRATLKHAGLRVESSSQASLF